MRSYPPRRAGFALRSTSRDRIQTDVPARIHVSGSCNPAFHATGAYYINADTTAFMQFIEGDLFRDFPQLRLIFPHGGGAVPYH